MPETGENKNQLNFSLDFRIISVVLAVVIVGMLAIWKPWQDNSFDTNRKITIQGEGTVKAEPDQFQFNPYYERSTIDEITKLNDEVVSGLKALGVADKEIKNNASQYGSPKIYYIAPTETEEEVVTLNLTVTLGSKELAQKVQDYLLTTNPKGSISPYPSFSREKQKQLQDQARTKAIADAREKADKTASGLGAKVGKVLQVSEPQMGGVYPMMAESMMGTNAVDRQTSLTIQPGEDELSYTVTVIFALK